MLVAVDAGRFTSASQRAEPALLAHGPAAASHDPELRMRAHVLSATVALVPAALAVLVGVNRRGDIIEGLALQREAVDFSIPEAWRRYLRRTAAVDPFAPACASHATVALLAELPAAAAHDYRAHLAGMGLADRADVYVRAAGQLVATVTLVRAAGAPGFTARDAAALRHLQPLLEHAHACALEPGVHAAHDGLRADGLSERETAVAELVGRGATNAEIARSLHLTEPTVKAHLTRVFAKLGLRTRTELAIRVGGRTPAGRP